MTKEIAIAAAAAITLIAVVWTAVALPLLERRAGVAKLAATAMAQTGSWAEFKTLHSQAQRASARAAATWGLGLGYLLLLSWLFAFWASERSLQAGIVFMITPVAIIGVSAKIWFDTLPIAAMMRTENRHDFTDAEVKVAERIFGLIFGLIKFGLLLKVDVIGRIVTLVAVLIVRMARQPAQARKWMRRIWRLLIR